MPLLVRLSDSEVEVIDLAIAQLSDGLDHARRVHEQVRAGRMASNQKAPTPDLNVEPVHGDAQHAGELLRAQHVGCMPPPCSLLDESLEAGAIADALDGDRQHFVGAIGGAMSLARQERQRIGTLLPPRSAMTQSTARGCHRADMRVCQPNHGGAWRPRITRSVVTRLQ